MEAEDSEGDQTELCGESVRVQGKSEGPLSLAVYNSRCCPSFPPDIPWGRGSTSPGNLSANGAD